MSGQGVNSQGVQMLLQAEKKASEVVKSARARKAQRLKQAKQEAEAEIQKMTQQAETTFKNKELQHDGASDESFVRINKDKQEKIAQLDASVAANKAEVIKKLLEISMHVEPRIHQNFRM